MLKKNKIDIPDWNQYYLNRKLKPAGKESFKKTGEEPAGKSDNVKPAVIIRGGDPKKTNTTLIYILAIACTLLVGYLAVYLYRQKRSGSV